MNNNSADTSLLIERARTGDRDAVNAIFARYRDRLRRMVELRLDRRLQHATTQGDPGYSPWGTGGVVTW
jgi:hypothetical protein